MFLESRRTESFILSPWREFDGYQVKQFICRSFHKNVIVHALCLFERGLFNQMSIRRTPLSGYAHQVDAVAGYYLLTQGLVRQFNYQLPTSFVEGCRSVLRTSSKLS